jgi:transcriptional regulator with XRE-family HTH domain
MTGARMIRSSRLAAGLTLDELASRSGVAKSTLSLYENGRRDPSSATLLRVLRATGHDLEVVESVPDAAGKAKSLERVCAIGWAMQRRARGDLGFPPFHTLVTR